MDGENNSPRSNSELLTANLNFSEFLRQVGIPELMQEPNNASAPPLRSIDLNVQPEESNEFTEETQWEIQNAEYDVRSSTPPSSDANLVISSGTGYNIPEGSDPTSSPLHLSCKQEELEFPSDRIFLRGGSSSGPEVRNSEDEIICPIVNPSSRYVVSNNAPVNPGIFSGSALNPLPSVPRPLMHSFDQFSAQYYSNHHPSMYPGEFVHFTSTPNVCNGSPTNRAPPCSSITSSASSLELSNNSYHSLGECSQTMVVAHPTMFMPPSGGLLAGEQSLTSSDPLRNPAVPAQVQTSSYYDFRIPEPSLVQPQVERRRQPSIFEVLEFFSSSSSDSQSEEPLDLGDIIRVADTGGLSDAQILLLLRRRLYLAFSAGSGCERDSCPICLGYYEIGQAIGIVDCGHEFHYNCITQWLALRNTCPICRCLALSN